MILFARITANCITFHNPHAIFLRIYHHYPFTFESSFSIWLHLLEDDDATSTIEVSPDIGPTIKANAASQMEAAIVALSGELTKLRTGRASPGTLLHAITICYLFIFSFWLSDLLTRLSVECLYRDA